MTDRHAELDAALERVIAAARAHLAAVKAADGRIDDDDGLARVRRAEQRLVRLRRACSTTSARSPRGTWSRSTRTRRTALRRGIDRSTRRPGRATTRTPGCSRCGSAATTGCPAWRRCCGWPRRPGRRPPRGSAEPVEGVGEAVLELLQTGDGSLGALDVPELEPLDGVVVVAEVGTPLSTEVTTTRRGRPVPAGRGRGASSVGSTSTRSWLDAEHADSDH